MSAHATAVCEDSLRRNEAANLWRQRSLSAYRDIARAVGPILDLLAAAGYSEGETFGVRLALEEALVNAIKHGNGCNPAKRVRLRYRVNDECFMAEVEDQGGGFDPKQVPDPLDPANWERASGRGLMLMRHHMTSVHFNTIGNCVRLCKLHAPA
jgi:serine/threonine-protein kinase RsbW